MATTNFDGNSYYKEWYAKNKDRLSQQRKVRYQADPAVRDKALERQKVYRETHDRPSTRGAPKFRAINGIPIQVYRISESAEMIGCSIEFIRKYENEGVIPRPLVDSTQRYYTIEQIKRMKAFYLLMNELKYNKDAALKEAAIEKHRAEMLAGWLA